MFCCKYQIKVDIGRGRLNVLMAVTENLMNWLGNVRGTIGEMFNRNQFSVCQDKLKRTC